MAHWQRKKGDYIGTVSLSIHPVRNKGYGKTSAREPSCLLGPCFLKAVWAFIDHIISVQCPAAGHT
jgi:hypothetical protein